jgi:Tol biopolymer transport system component
MKRRRLTTELVVALVLALAGSGSAQTRPSVDDLVAFKRPVATAISPDGQRVAYTIREVNWKDDEFQTQVWLADLRTGANCQLTRAPRSSDSPRWSPDGKWLAFGSDRSGKRQVHRIDPAGGEAEPLTSVEDGILDFEWSPDSTQIAYTAVDAKPGDLKDRDERYGEVEILGEDRMMSHLHLLDVASKATRRLTEGAFAVDRFSWSPDGKQIAFDHRPSRELSYLYEADISIVSVADRHVRGLVTRPGVDSRPLWSPDGSRILFSTSGGDANAYFYTTSKLALVPAAGGAIQPLETGIDESPILVDWGPQGIFFWNFARSWAYLYRFDPATARTERLAPAAGARATARSSAS